MNALTLPPALRFNAPLAPEAVARFGAAIGAPDDPAAKVEELARLGGFERLRDFGVPEDELPAVAEAAAGRHGQPAEPAAGDAGRDRGASPLDLLISRLIVGLAFSGSAAGVAAGAPFDVLVIGSGASGPRRRRLGRARRRPRRGRDEGLAPGRATRRRRRAGSRPRSAPTTRPSSTPRTSGARRHETADTRPRRGADRRGAGRDPLARGARRRVHARERRLPPRPLRRRVAEAPAPGRRPHRPRDHEGAPRGVGGRLRHVVRARAAPRARADRERLARARAASTTIDAGTVVLAAGGRCYARGPGARRALDEPSRTRPAR